MADAASDLPPGERVLIRRIVSYQQDRLRLIQLLHGEQGIAGTLAQRRDQSRVIHRPVMINVVRCKRRARHPLQQVILFI